MQTLRAGMIPAVIADRLRTLRREAGLTREELAAETGISWRCIVNYELGHVAGMRADNLFKYADVFDVSTDYLLGRVDAKGGGHYG